MDRMFNMWQRAIVISTLLFFTSTSYGETIVAKVIDVHDGDTFYINIDNTYNTLGKRLPVRVRGIDSPELTSKNPSEKQLARRAADIAYKKLMNQTVVLTNVKRDKYFRLNADVTILKTKENFGRFMLDNGFAKPYNGGTRPIWNRKYWICK